jgi:hypothetical protein
MSLFVLNYGHVMILPLKICSTTGTSGTYLMHARNQSKIVPQLRLCGSCDETTAEEKSISLEDRLIIDGRTSHLATTVVKEYRSRCKTCEFALPSMQVH